MTLKYYLSLGSNIEPRLEYLQNACDKLTSFGRIIKVSGLYETEAWGNKNQDDFYNVMIEYDSVFPPRRLLNELKTIEKKIGRNSVKRWSAREIDIDIIFCQNFRIDEPDLHIPHAEFSRRRFILEPMAEINRNFLLPDTKLTIADYLDACQDLSRVHKLATNWWENGN